MLIFEIERERKELDIIIIIITFFIYFNDEFIYLLYIKEIFLIFEKEFQIYKSIFLSINIIKHRTWFGSFFWNKTFVFD